MEHRKTKDQIEGAGNAEPGNAGPENAGPCMT